MTYSEPVLIDDAVIFALEALVRTAVEKSATVAAG